MNKKHLLAPLALALAMITTGCKPGAAPGVTPGGSGGLIPPPITSLDSFTNNNTDLSIPDLSPQKTNGLINPMTQTQLDAATLASDKTLIGLANEQVDINNGSSDLFDEAGPQTIDFTPIKDDGAASADSKDTSSWWSRLLGN